MSMRPIPQISLNISRSPLLSSNASHPPESQAHLSILFARQVPKNGGGYDSVESLAGLGSLSSFTSSIASSSLGSTSHDGLSTKFVNLSNKPLPSLPCSGSATRIPPHAIISLLDLLDEFDVDVEVHVARVKEGIKEVYEMVDDCKAERRKNLERERKLREIVKRETKEIGSDFWLGV